MTSAGPVADREGIAAFGREVYIRPFGEMNGYWNPYCAYTRAPGSTWDIASKPRSRAAYRRYITPLGS